MLTAKQVKEYAKQCGADLVGIAPMDRFEGAPKQMDPRYIMPEAKAMIVMGFRIPRGCLRGIEEGTFYVSYCGMGYAGINHVLQPMVLWKLTAMLEDEGYEALPIPNNFPWTNTDSSGQNPEKTGLIRETFSRPVSPDRPAPDVFIHMRIAAFCAGLGEIGYSKIFLSLNSARDSAWPPSSPKRRWSLTRSSKASCAIVACSAPATALASASAPRRPSRSLWPAARSNGER